MAYDIYMLPSKKLERIIKGISNHNRIDILKTLENYPYITLEDAAAKLALNYKTASAHIKILENSGLIRKQHHKINVRHSLTQKGKTILKFLRILE